MALLEEAGSGERAEFGIDNRTTHDYLEPDRYVDLIFLCGIVEQLPLAHV